jgi:hypothetical protein
VYHDQRWPANAKRPTRSVESKTERVAAAKTRVKIDQPKVERVTKQERVLDRHTELATKAREICSCIVMAAANKAHFKNATN